jgi:hypothetical protein
MDLEPELEAVDFFLVFLFYFIPQFSSFSVSSLIQNHHHTSLLAHCHEMLTYKYINIYIYIYIYIYTHTHKYLFKVWKQRILKTSISLLKLQYIYILHVHIYCIILYIIHHKVSFGSTCIHVSTLCT